MSNIVSNAEIRKHAREQLSGKWGLAVLVTLISSAISLIVQYDETIGLIISIIIGGPLLAGVTLVFLKIARKEHVEWTEMFSGFQRFVQFFVLYVLSGILLILWTLLLIVPGIIAALRYSQAYFLMLDDPNLEALDAIKMSSKMMYGYKGQLFMLYLSFIGWFLLCILTLGIGLLFLVPYVTTAQANFYEQLKATKAPIQT